MIYVSSLKGYAYVGGVAGECGGIRDAAYSGTVLSIGSKLEGEKKVGNIGGIAGVVNGSVENCTNTKRIDVS